MDLYIQSFNQLTAIIQGLVFLSEDLVGMPKPIKSFDVEVRLYQIKIPHFLNNSQRNEVEHCFELEKEIRAWGLMVEVRKGKRNSRSIFKKSLLRLEIFDKVQKQLLLAAIGVGLKVSIEKIGLMSVFPNKFL